MNKRSRLTALLLALIMLLSSVSLAEGGLPIGGASGLTGDDWADLVDAAEEKLFFTDEGDTGKVVTPESPEQPEKSDSYPYTDVEAMQLVKSDASAEATITASGAAILFHEAAGQWQISLGGVWANLSGETGEALTVTRTMMNGQNRAEFRKALGEKNAETGEYADCTQTAVINLIENPPAMFSVSRGASDTAVSDVNDGIMTLELANQENMVLVQVIYRIEGTDQPVAEAYIGQIAKGSALNTTLTLPRVTGYKANAIAGKAGALEIPAEDLAKYATFIPPKETEQGTLTLAVTKALSVQDITIYVEYAPAEVSYTVKHLQQNIDDDEYTEVATETKTGLTGAPVGEKHAKTYKGFSAIWYDPTTTIAADGSTVVEIHYNREYYLMTFDLGGGYGVEPIFARFGADVSVGTPQRAGYTFKEWTYEDGTAVGQMPTTMPVGGGRYKAVWEAADTTYTVVYWRADVDDGDETTPTTYSYWGYETVGAKSGDELTPSKVGEKYPVADVEMIAKDEETGYFTYDAGATKEKNIDKKTDVEKTVTVAGDGTSVVNVYYSRNVYEIRYIYARKNGDKIQIATLTKNGVLSNCEWTDVNDIPAVTDSRFVSKHEDIDGITYYYISIEAEYGASIERIWPAAAIGGTGNYRWGSWAAEAGTGYRTTYGNEHANIVGAYPAMSADMIKTPGNAVAQRMIAWWGTTSSTIVDHSYHVYFETLSGQKEADTDKEYKNKWYAFKNTTVFTCAHNGSTRVDPFVYEGYVCVNNDKTAQGDSKNDKFSNNADCPLDDPTTKNKHEGCAYCNVFYYDRNKYTLSFYNYNDESEKPAEKSLMFGESFTGYDPGEPNYPVGVESGSMRFVGWYTTPECFDGTEVDWENGAMPASDLTFYAKWELVKHDVNFWIDKAGVGSADAAQKVTSYTDITHGKRITEEKQDAEDYLDPQKYFQDNPNSPYQGYGFAGWYYMDGDVEKRFDIKTMPIRNDMDIYAKWTSNTPVKFVFRYVHVDANGNEPIELAPPTEGLALPNSPVTMSAKIGTDLTQVPDGNDPLSYIPEVSSHTLDIQVDETKNVFVFKYHMPEKVKYTVQYLAAEYKNIDGKSVLVISQDANGEPIHLIDEKTVETEKAVVTENYVPVTQYMPQATQLRLIVSMKEEKNLIQFLYVKNEKEAPYNVSHYIIDHTGKASLHTSEMNRTDKIDAEVAVNKLKDEDIPGYTFAYAKVAVPEQQKDGTWKDKLYAPEHVTDTQVLHKLPAAGMHVYLYYKPIEYPFKVQYINAKTNEKIKDDKIAALDEYKPYGSTLNTAYYVVEIVNHRFVRFDPATWTVDVEKNNSDPTVNVLTIYYELDVADISITKEIVVLTGENTIEPSEEDMHTEFKFTVKLTPKEGKDMDTVAVTLPDEERKNVAIPDGTLTFALKDDQTAIIHDLWVGTQYEIEEADYDSFTTTYSVTPAGTLTALGVDMEVANTFPKYAGELTIKKTGMQENKESAIVKANVGGVDYYLVLNGSNGYTATITGIRPDTNYTVSEIGAWTWQYGSVNSISGKISADNMTPTVTIDNTKKPDQWLHDESHVENDFGTGQSTGVNE